MVSPQPLDQGPNGRVLPPGNPANGAFLPPICKLPTATPELHLATFYFTLELIPSLWGQVSTQELDTGYLCSPLISRSKGSVLFFHCSHLSPQPSQPRGIFSSQGDKEAELGLPFSPLCDRTSTLVAQSQIGESEGEEERSCLGLARLVLSLQVPKLFFLLRQGCWAGCGVL